MSIASIMDEGRPRKSSLQDLRWLETGLIQPGNPSFSPTGVIGQKDNNIKDDLQLEWGYGTIPPDLSEPDAGRVERTMPEGFDAAPIIFFARDLMNRGFMGRRLSAALRAKFSASDLIAAKDQLSKQLALQGIVGTVAVDGRGYKDCKAALRSASRSPFKGFIKYVIGCSCGTPHMMPESREAARKVEASTGNPTDDFIAAAEPHKMAMVSHCRSTMLPILASRGDLDKSELDQTLTEMMNVTGLPSSIAAKIRAADATNLNKVRVAFRFLAENTEKGASSKYEGKVNTSEFVIDTEERPIELVEPVDASQIDIDPRPARMSAEQPKPLVPDDVEMTTFEEPEFRGGSDIELDEPHAPQSDLDIDMGGGGDIELDEPK